MNEKTDFELLKESLEEALEHSKGKITLKTTKVKIPDPAPELSPRAISSLRNKLRMSQAFFAKLLNISTETATKWEQGERHPNGAALRLLQVLHKNPNVIFNV